MKILVLNYEFPPIGGGAGDVSASLCKEFISSGHEVKVLTSHFRGLPKYEIEAGYEIIRVPAFRRHKDHSNFFQMACYLIGAQLPLRSLCIRWNPDIIHCHFLLPTGTLALLANIKYKIPYVITLHGGDVPSFVPEQTHNLFRLFRPIADFATHKSSRIIAVSSDLAELAKNDFPKSAAKISHIDNGICIPDEKNIPKFMQTTFLVAGRLSVQKNIDYLLQASANVHEEFQIIILGDGPERMRLEQTARQLGLETRVHFKGWVERKTVIDHMRRSHFLIMPSLAEGMPIAGLQAYACGLPVIGTNVPGLKHFIIDGQTGFLTDLNVADQFSEILTKACTCTELCETMGNNAMRLAREKYSWPAIAQSYLQLFMAAG